MRDPQDVNNWKWVNGNDVTVSFWNAPGGNENCARFDGSKGWLWADTDCHSRLNYICQHRKFTFLYCNANFKKKCKFFGYNANLERNYLFCDASFKRKFGFYKQCVANLLSFENRRVVYL